MNATKQEGTTQHAIVRTCAIIILKSSSGVVERILEEYNNNNISQSQLLRYHTRSLRFSNVTFLVNVMGH